MSSQLRDCHLSTLDRGLRKNLFVPARCSASLLFLRSVCPWKPNGTLFVCWLLTAQGCKIIFATIPSQLGEAKHIHATSVGAMGEKSSTITSVYLLLYREQREYLKFFPGFFPEKCLFGSPLKMVCGMKWKTRDYGCSGGIVWITVDHLKHLVRKRGWENV